MAIEMMNCFGGSATAMPISDVYTAMQSGVIDGAENNETALTVGGHGEVAKCYSYDEHTRIPDIVLISTKVWNKFSVEQQEIVQAAADAAKETYKADWQAAIEQAVKDAGKREQTFCVDGDILAHPDTDCHRFFYFSEKRRKNFVYLMKNA